MTREEASKTYKPNWKRWFCQESTIKNSLLAIRAYPNSWMISRKPKWPSKMNSMTFLTSRLPSRIPISLVRKTLKKLKLNSKAFMKRWRTSKRKRTFMLNFWTANGLRCKKKRKWWDQMCIKCNKCNSYLAFIYRRRKIKWKPWKKTKEFPTKTKKSLIKLLNSMVRILASKKSI